MAFDEALAVRVRNVLPDGESVIEKRMFGGIAFLLNGNMCCGVRGDELIVRLDPAHAEDALGEPHVRVFDLTGRGMKGWVRIASDRLGTDGELQAWVSRGVEFAASLPAK
jgi:TfoX/Sxy family transcriptional regulator of competence genes